ncbi:hypothetical protein P7K49_027545 [Saguinus oedipus]|uniref:PDZ domain-containing protein n=1 Tax=Saguinus oedipus TaxID=9490 RepID=A0ABQ9U9T2_SAGOE|nr:hypothetical protein P7K49_027545 [Saguinus oedipus]
MSSGLFALVAGPWGSPSPGQGLAQSVLVPPGSLTCHSCSLSPALPRPLTHPPLEWRGSTLFCGFRGQEARAGGTEPCWWRRGGGGVVLASPPLASPCPPSSTSPRSRSLTAPSWESLPGLKMNREPRGMASQGGEKAPEWLLQELLCLSFSLRPLSCRFTVPLEPSMALTVDVAGPAPWGFRITGGRDFHTPIMVTKQSRKSPSWGGPQSEPASSSSLQVAERGKAKAADLRPGDIIVAINGESTEGMLHTEAQSKIRQSPSPLRLQLDR